MAVLSLPYYPHPIQATDPFPNGQVAYRPLLIVRLREPHNGKFLTCIALADTGADHCVFPASFLSLLGLDPLTLPSQTTHGVGSVNITYYADVLLEVPMKAGANAQSLSLDVRAGFMTALDSQGQGLLGQVGFFDRFAVTFDHAARLFHVDIQGA